MLRDHAGANCGVRAAALSGYLASGRFKVAHNSKSGAGIPPPLTAYSSQSTRSYLIKVMR